MPEPIISVEHLSKKYTISHRPSYGTLRDSLTDLVIKPFQKHTSRKDSEEFWALQDLNFTVQPGERIGIIGRNGAGKSTLLKILSQITPPTSGKITIRGRVASLLEVGTGFHPELTGRENVFLNGAILGMRQSEITSKFNEIVQFADVERFIDTPVKRYSSGMYVRLAFSIAAHLEPDILIIDEVLAVGDVEFQKKCVGKMEEVAGHGRTIIFVSHNMATIAQLCNRTLLLDQGKVQTYAATHEVVDYYLSGTKNSTVATVDLQAQTLRKNSRERNPFRWSSITLRNSSQEVTSIIQYHEPFTIIFEADVSEKVDNIFLSCVVNAIDGLAVFNTSPLDLGQETDYAPGKYQFSIPIDPHVLAPGRYTIGIGANGSNVVDWIPVAIEFTVTDTNTITNQHWGNQRVGSIHLTYHWTQNKIL